MKFRPNADVARVPAELGWSEGLSVVISDTRLVRDQGIAQGREAFALIAESRRDLRFLIVDEGPAPQASRKQVVSFGIGDHVGFAARVAREAMPSYLNGAAVLIFTTTHMERKPLNALEALAVGLPAVVSRHRYPFGPPSDQFRLIKPTDSADVAAMLLRAPASPPSRGSNLPVGCSATATIEQCLTFFEEWRRRRAVAVAGS